MKTDYQFGVRTSDQRFRGGKNHTAMWTCDNPKCTKVYHYSSGCPNTVPSLMTKWWYRFFNRIF